MTSSHICEESSYIRVIMSESYQQPSGCNGHGNLPSFLTSRKNVCFGIKVLHNPVARCFKSSATSETHTGSSQTNSRRNLATETHDMSAVACQAVCLRQCESLCGASLQGYAPCD